MRIYLAINKQKEGPYSQEDVQTKLVKGEIDSSTLAWYSGLAEWTAIGSLPEIVPVPEASHMPSPSAMAPAHAPLASPIRCSRAAIAALVLGILSLVGGLFTGIPAIVCGHRARGRIARPNSCLSGSKLALVGLVLGYTMTILTAAALVPIIAVAIATVKENNQKVQVRNDISSIVAAMKAYNTEYSKWPGITNPKSERDLTVGLTDTPNSTIIGTLRDISDEPNSEHQLNLRRVVFLDVRHPSAPKGSPSALHVAGPVDERGCLFDPWGNQYRITVDADYSGTVQTPSGEAIQDGVLVWSPGPDHQDGTADDLTSWSPRRAAVHPQVPSSKSER